MSFADHDLTRDAFLGGALHMYQPRKGYRGATDPVFLAAAIAAKAGDTVLELGCGAGVALSSLCRRISGTDAHGLELQPDYAALAVRNARENNLEMTIHQGNLLEMPPELRARNFDHVFANPPFYRPDGATSPQDKGRDTAHMEGEATLEHWISAGLKRLKQGGYFTVIHRIERLGDILGGLQAGAGDVRILPLASRINRPAGRVIVRARKGSNAPLQLMPAMVLHKGAHHEKDGDSYSHAAENILRHMEPLIF